MPTEPPESSFNLPDPRPSDGDVVAVGGDLSPGLVLQAYRKGLFPMHLPDGHLGWWSPVERAVLGPTDLRISRSLRQSCRRYRLSVDRNFEDVLIGCAEPVREGTWITQEFVSTYTALHRMGWAHSIEVWDSTGMLVGGLYGVNIGSLFAGESMFHRARDASKVALVHLTALMSSVSSALLDVQWRTPHLGSMGAGVIGRDEYLRRLPAALDGQSPFPDPNSSGDS